MTASRFRSSWSPFNRALTSGLGAVLGPLVDVVAPPGGAAVVVEGVAPPPGAAAAGVGAAIMATSAAIAANVANDRVWVLNTGRTVMAMRLTSSAGSAAAGR